MPRISLYWYVDNWSLVLSKSSSCIKLQEGHHNNDLEEIYIRSSSKIYFILVMTWRISIKQFVEVSHLNNPFTPREAFQLITLAKNPAMSHQQSRFVRDLVASLYPSDSRDTLPRDTCAFFATRSTFSMKCSLLWEVLHPSHLFLVTFPSFLLKNSLKVPRFSLLSPYNLPGHPRLIVLWMGLLFLHIAPVSIWDCENLSL